VLSNNDGYVIARSNEAKAVRIEMGAPWHLSRELFEKHVIVRSSNYTLFGDISARDAVTEGCCAARATSPSVRGENL
jgi:DNA polymerase V